VTNQPSTAIPTDAEADVDALQRRIDELESSLVHAQRLSSLGSLAAIIAHELNNILTPVLNYAKLATLAPDDQGRAIRALSKTVDGVRSASRITEAVLGYARTEEAEAPASVLEAVENALACVARKPEKDRIALVVDVPADCFVPMSATALQQVLLNLILNAREAMHAKAGTLRIAAERSTWNTGRGGGAIEITVADTGRGIEPGALSRVFEPFYTRRAETSPEQGAGLGLAICKHLIEGAGGVIEAASAPGKGATFTIRLDDAADSGA
jgi:signal transduction histidine kinase